MKAWQETYIDDAIRRPQTAKERDLDGTELASLLKAAIKAILACEK